MTSVKRTWYHRLQTKKEILHRMLWIMLIHMMTLMMRKRCDAIQNHCCIWFMEHFNTSFHRFLWTAHSRFFPIHLRMTSFNVVTHSPSNIPSEHFRFDVKSVNAFSTSTFLIQNARWVIIIVGLLCKGDDLNRKTKEQRIFHLGTIHPTVLS